MKRKYKPEEAEGDPNKCRKCVAEEYEGDPKWLKPADEDDYDESSLGMSYIDNGSAEATLRDPEDPIATKFLRQLCNPADNQTGHEDAEIFKRLQLEHGTLEAAYHIASHSTNESKAWRWLKAAAKEGHPKAIRGIGIAYSEEIDRQSLEKAGKWLSLGLEKGDTKCAFNLGRLYEEGVGVEKDEVEARRLFQIAVDEGSAIAAWYLGDMCTDGKGGDIDVVKAVSLYKTVTESELGEWGEGEDCRDILVDLFKVEIKSESYSS